MGTVAECQGGGSGAIGLELVGLGEDCWRHGGTVGVLCRLGSRASGFGSRQRQLAPTETLQPSPAAGVLSGGVVEPADRRAVSAVLYRKRGERLVHSQALLAPARRWVDVLWALLRDGREFTVVKPIVTAAA